MSRVEGTVVHQAQQGPGAAGGPRNDADRFLEKAMSFRGQPYRWGGGHAHGTFSAPGPVDCSGLVTQAGRMAGVNLDGTAAVQQRRGRPVSMAELKPGDLVFRGQPAYHVGIYLGDGKVLHAPKTGDVVRVATVEGWDSARRVFDDAGQAVDTTGMEVDTAPTRGGPRSGPAGGDSASMQGGNRSSGLGFDALDSEEERRKRGRVMATAQGGKAAGAGAAPGGPVHSGLTNVNATSPGNLGDVLAKLEALGISKDELQALSEEHGVPLELILAVVKQESGGDPNAQSHAGAQGLMQLMPDTARGLGVENSLDPRQNLAGGVKYLAQMLQRYDGDTTKALAAYNAGPGNVDRYGGVPPFAETRKYVANITAMLQQA